MELIHGLEKIQPFSEKTFLTIGTFDGVHIGHQEVIKKVVSSAKREGGTSVIITFDPHPRSLFGKYNDALTLTSTPHKLNLIDRLNVDICVLIEFDKDFAEMPADTFIKDVLYKKLNLKKIILGARTRFGKNRQGTAGLMQEMGEEFGFDVEVVNDVKINNIVVSSTVIRKYVHSGELEFASAFLGRQFSIWGTVIKGQTVGRHLGYPTANLDPHNEVIPPSGVYAVEVILDNRPLSGVLNIGFRQSSKSLDDVVPAIEVHIIDFDQNIYGRDIEVIFHKKIREEKRFSQKQALIEQIKEDESEARKYFESKLRRNITNTNTKRTVYYGCRFTDDKFCIFHG